jgi:ankyrin repeat protein
MMFENKDSEENTNLNTQFNEVLNSFFSGVELKKSFLKFFETLSKSKQKNLVELLQIKMIFIKEELGENLNDLIVFSNLYNFMLSFAFNAKELNSNFKEAVKIIISSPSKFSIEYRTLSGGQRSVGADFLDVFEAVPDIYKQKYLAFLYDLEIDFNHGTNCAQKNNKWLHSNIANTASAQAMFLLRNLPKNKFNINALSEYGNTPLQLAATKGYRIKNVDHQTISHSYVEIVEEIIAFGADVNTKATEKMRCNTALHMACLREDAEMIAVLLKNNADVNVKNLDNKTALELLDLTEEEKVSFLEQFNDGQLLCNFKDSSDYTRDVNACKKMLTNKDEKEIDEIYQARHKEIFFEAVKRGDIEKVKNLINKKLATLNDQEGRGALHLACALGYKAIVEALITHGAHVNMQDKQGRTPADYTNLDSTSVKTILMSVNIDPDRDVSATENAFHRVIESLDQIKSLGLKATQLISTWTNPYTHGEILFSVENKAFAIKQLPLLDEEDQTALRQQIDNLRGKTVAQACIENRPSIGKLLVDIGREINLNQDKKVERKRD